jgi:hypothetical protein
VLVAIYALSAGLCVAVATGVLRWRLTPIARGVLAAGALLMAYPFWSQAGRPGASSELPLATIALGLAAGAVLFAIGTLQGSGRVWRVIEVAGALLMAAMFAIPTRIVFVLPLVAAVLGWVLRRASGREVLADPPPPRASR